MRIEHGSLYMSSRPKSLCVPTFICPLKLFSKGKNNLLLDDFLWNINDTMFYNSFANQHIFHYYELRNNENEETLDPKITINVDNKVEDNVNNKTIPCVPEFRDVFRFTFLFIITGHLVVNVSRKLWFEDWTNN